MFSTALGSRQNLFFKSHPNRLAFWTSRRPLKRCQLKGRTGDGSVRRGIAGIRGRQLSHQGTPGDCPRRRQVGGSVGPSKCRRVGGCPTGFCLDGLAKLSRSSKKMHKYTLRPGDAPKKDIQCRSTDLPFISF